MKQTLSYSYIHEKLKEIIEEVPVCFFITHHSGSSRPMATTRVDENNNIWFLSRMESGKIRDLENDESVRLLYCHPGKNKYLDIQGNALLVTGKTKIKELWNPVAEAWFPKGLSDPDLCLVKIVPYSGYYWDAGENCMVEVIKLIASVVSRKKPVDSKERRLSL